MSSTTARPRTRCVPCASAVFLLARRLTICSAAAQPHQATLTTIRDVVEARGGKLIHVDELRKDGKQSPADLSKKATRDQTFCIMYTSVRSCLAYGRELVRLGFGR